MSSGKEQLKKDWFILRSLVSKDFKLKYRPSVLGVLWPVLNPLLMMAVLTAVFSTIFHFDIDNFPLYLILGQTLFAFMTEVTSSAMGSIIESAPLTKKIRTNKMIFPVEKSCVCAGEPHSDGSSSAIEARGFSNGFLTVSPGFGMKAQAFIDLALDVVPYESGSIVRCEAPFVNAAWPLAAWTPPLSA